MKALHQLPAPASGSPKSRWSQWLLLLTLALGTTPVVAQRRPALPPTPPALAPTDTARQVVELPAATLDSLARAPQLEPVVDSARLVWLQTPATLAEIVGDRLGCIETAAPHQFNAAVLAYVRLFTERQRGYTQRVLEREQFYFPIFEKYLAQYNLPLELKYLSVVESSLIPTAKSPVGAVGLWQFMPPTASDLRLKRDEWVDERMHPEKATEAACKHLRYLYGEFHDWELVLAAYNWGAGNMRRVMRKTGKKNFWDLYPSLPAETRNYVPTFTAIMYAMMYATEHSLRDPALRYQAYEPLDTLGLRGQALDLRRLSRALGYADSTALARYNPEVRQGGLPAGYRPYVLRYPSAAREQLSGVDRATLLAYCQPLNDLPQALPPRLAQLAGTEPWTSRDELATAPTPPPAAGPRHRRQYYIVRRGQTVADIAEKFAVSPAQLRRWNELPKHAATLKPGRELLVLVPLPPTPAPAAVIAAAPSPRRPMPVDSATLALAAANARYARAALATAQREEAQLQELQRLKKQLAARVAAQQQAIFRTTALTKASLAEKAKQQAALAASPALAADEATYSDSSAATVTPARPGKLLAVATTISEAAPMSAGTDPAPAPAAPRPRRASSPPTATHHRLEPDFSTHVVQKGDTLYNISRRFRVSVEQLRRLNKLKSDDVKLGQKLVVQAG
ncbi:LysM peptidoglycan-binding domain-containing protein [Hymenobacter psoromatis]|uniref:LysM peptidoglycan-binding domain-containing protein n=1 Tax=Hymenobacter psoromatis TaxID=1484116 RepID=UPI001CBF38E2|nr:LysM peptidoglycan-binding domain-containing protein [Hymenobacter psoromatis]